MQLPPTEPSRDASSPLTILQWWIRVWMIHYSLHDFMCLKIFFFIETLATIREFFKEELASLEGSMNGDRVDQL